MVFGFWATPPSAPLPLSWPELFYSAFDAQPLSVQLLLLLNSTLLLLLLRPLIPRLIPRKRRVKRARQAPFPIALTKRSAPPKLIRKDGEWSQVDLSELDPTLGKAWQQLCAAAAAATAPEDAAPEDAAGSIYGPVQPIEEYDTLRALKARRLNLPRTLEWLHSHRRWWRENQPREKRFCMQGDPGVQVCFGSGMARWFALNKQGIPYFYTDLQCWAPHLVSCADHTNFAISGLELMREAGRQFCPGAPEHGALIDIRHWAMWHANYIFYILDFFLMFLEHYPQCVHRIYLLNAPPVFAYAWKVIRRGLDEWTRERIDFVTDDEIFNGGYFLEHFDAADLFTTLGGTRDPAELQSTTVPGFWQQPGTEVDPALLFDWRKTPLPPAVQALSKLALEQAKRKKARR